MTSLIWPKAECISSLRRHINADILAYVSRLVSCRVGRLLVLGVYAAGGHLGTLLIGVAPLLLWRD